MRRLIRKLASNKGFSLVECVIAIAVFAIMSLMVATIIAATQFQYKKNIEAQMGLGGQVEAVIDEDSFAEELKSDSANALSITFEDALGTVKGTIAQDVNGTKLRKETYEDTQSVYEISTTKSFYEKLKFCQYGTDTPLTGITASLRQTNETDTTSFTGYYKEYISFDLETTGTSFDLYISLPLGSFDEDKMLYSSGTVTMIPTSSGVKLSYFGTANLVQFKIWFSIPVTQFNNNYGNLVRFFASDCIGQEVFLWNGTSYDEVDYSETPISPCTLLGVKRTY